MKRIIFISTILLCFLSTPLFAQVTVGDAGTLSGTVFADYYWVAQNHDTNLENNNGFWFRRIYITYERTFSDAFSSRVRFEAASSGDFQSEPEMVPNIKDAYLKWKNDSHQILAGISSTPTWGLVEDVWGYRSVEKSPLDLHDYGSSRDFGLSFKGQIDNSGKLNYHFFVGNGNSNKAEIDKGKKVMFSLAYNITDHLVIEGYADWNSHPNRLDSYVGQFFAGYRSDILNIGALGAYRGEGSFDIEDTPLDLVSLFTNFRISDNVKGYLRADHQFEPYPNGNDNSYIPFAENVESTFMVGGVDILLEDKIHLMPNVEAIVYGERANGQQPTTDIIPRMTLFYEF
jgi:hypothetical protein